MQNLLQFRTSSNFSGEYFGADKDIQNRITIWSTAIPSTFGEKNLVNFRPVTRNIWRSIVPKQRALFGRPYFGP